MKLRGMLPGEDKYLVKLWLESFWTSEYARRYRRPGGKRIYLQAHGERLHRILERADVRVACDPDEPSLVEAFAVVEPPNVVHWIGAKRYMHRAGASRALFELLLRPELANDCVYTHELVELRDYAKYLDGFAVPSTWRLDEYAIGGAR